MYWGSIIGEKVDRRDWKSLIIFRLEEVRNQINLFVLTHEKYCCGNLGKRQDI